jgi:hypothetical protein
VSPGRDSRRNRIIVIALVSAAAFAGAALASRPTATGASNTSDPRIRVLQRQVKTLQTQVRDLQKRANQFDGYFDGIFTATTCVGATTADLIQGTWGVIDQIAQATQQRTYFGPQTSVPDYADCSTLVQPRVPRVGVVVPPTINPLLPLLQWLHT